MQADPVTQGDRPVTNSAASAPEPPRRVSVRLPGDLYRRLEAYADRRGVTVSVLARMLLSASMDREAR